MAERYNRPPTRRGALIESTNRANIDSTPNQHHHSKTPLGISKPTGHLPHNESILPNGSLTVRSSPHASPQHKRLAAITSEEKTDAKRLSQISTTSTNASDVPAGRRRKSHIGPWQLGKTIGKGGCSRVRAVRHTRTHQYAAAKIVAKSTAEQVRAQSLANLVESSEKGLPDLHASAKVMPFGLEREIVIMKLLEHRNIVRLYDVWENKQELYLIMEYVQGEELFTYIESRRGLPEDETIYLFRQLIAALLYCHRLHIHHRDLKPENILIDTNSHEIKLADFGMAALQPEGKFLSTPCGSPHYAAPEVVSKKQYDGGKADVWSCGVILYVMLTGTTPYNYSREGDLRAMFKTIARAEYYMPPELSFEAKDLIRKIFVPDPTKRISMDDIWEHPFLHKYDQQFGYTGQDGNKELWIGPKPRIEDWTVNRIQDIDREILRNMRTLWHSEPEQSLIQKLLSAEPNQQKLFYAALMKHQEEHHELFAANAGAIGYSNSDTHHIKPAIAGKVSTLPAVKQQRSQSQYSILNDEHLRPSHSFYEPPPSVRSYDPYRASRNPIVDKHSSYLNVTVHRGSSGSNGQASTSRTLRHPGSLRVDILKKGSQQSSDGSRSSLSRKYSPAPRTSLGHRSISRGSLPRTSMSRHSMTSSVWPSSPPVLGGYRPTSVHKRGVSFAHARRSSTISASTAADSARDGQHYTTELREKARRSQRETAGGLPDMMSSPAAQTHDAVRSRKEAVSAVTPRIRVKKPDTPSRYIMSEARKVSTELEKACEEAFFRSSIGSSINTATSNKPSPCDTPPSSVSNRGSGPSSREISHRPLPAVPVETPNTFMLKTLEEAKNKLAARYATDGLGNMDRYNEVMATLDRIMPTSSRTEEKRIISAPEIKSPDQLGFLPIIREEGRSDDLPAGVGYRSVTAPVFKHPLPRRPDDSTIRMVQPSSPSPIAPLNVRKRSGDSLKAHTPGPNTNRNSVGTAGRLNAKASCEGLLRQKTDDGATALPSAGEEMANTVLSKRKPSWFRRHINPTKEQDEESARPHIPSAWTDLDDRLTPQKVQRRTLGKERKVSENEKDNEKITLHDALLHDSTLSSASSEFPMRRPAEVQEKKGLSRWFGRKKEHEEGKGFKLAGKSEPARPSFKRGLDSVEPARTYHTNASLSSLFSLDNTPRSPTTHRGAPPEPARSWFSRFLRLRPQTRVLCFALPRGRARAELVRLLREWQRHSIRDLQYSREKNSISATVDRNNALGIKELSFSIELFVVLREGKKVGLSVGRFVLVKGRGKEVQQGFVRVVEGVASFLGQRGWMVEDEGVKKEMGEILSG
ncbi:serine/threonine-protein kinase gin4 [Elasticomyces elasticus]|nr:serine/threonine-protein kinase gin4 [Elasticomyces elasticus]